MFTCCVPPQVLVGLLVSYRALPQRGKPSRQLFAFLRASLSLFHQTADPNKNHGADKRNDDGPDDSSTRPNSEHPEYPAANDAAKNAEDDVYQHSISAALHHLPGEPACDEPDHNPGNHAASFFSEAPKDGMAVRLPCVSSRPRLAECQPRGLHWPASKRFHGHGELMTARIRFFLLPLLALTLAAACSK